MKYRNKITGDIVEPAAGLHYTNEYGAIRIPKNIVEQGNDWEKIEDKPKNYTVSNGKAVCTNCNGVEFKLRDIVHAETFPHSYRGEAILSFYERELTDKWVLIAQLPGDDINVDVLKKALFTTVDGVHVFDENTPLYMVSDSGKTTANAARAWDAYGKPWKCFSSKEARLTYMSMHIPVLTVKEIFDIAKSHRDSELIIRAKDKLKANDSNL